AEDRPVSGDNGVAVRPPFEHPEVGLTMPDEAVELDEGARIEELDEPLACEQLALLALTLDRLVGAGVLGLVTQLLKLIKLRLGGVGARLVGRRHRRSVPRACGSEPQASQYRSTAFLAP